MKINISTRVYLAIIVLSSVLIVWPIFLTGYFFHHDDLQVMRVFEMKRCIQDFQIPCRWVPDMGYGNGYPLFNYYSALPYYIGGLLSFIFGLVNSAKALFFIPLVLGGVTMFFLAEKLFGKEAGFLSAILYSFAPYRALDSYVRGAVAESFAISIVPLVFYFVIKIIEKPNKKDFVLGSVTLAAFLLCHNIMTVFFMPFVVLWGLLFLYLNKWKNWKAFSALLVLGIGLAGFFLLPVFLEKSLVQTETLLRGGGDFRAHFVTVNQLFFDRIWGYGGSQFGPNDTISFQIGWPLWWFVPLALVVLLLKFKKDIRLTLVSVFFLFIFAVSVFMTHNKSAFIWEMLGFLQYAQFPWRFLSLSIFSSAILAGYVFNILNFRFRTLVIFAAASAAIFLNWNYFIPRDFYPWINDKNKLEDPLWEIQQKAGILDYLPKTAYEPPSRAAINPEILNGLAEVSNYDVRSNKFSFKVKVLESTTDKVDSSAYIQVPVFDFPNWTVYVNGNKIAHDNKSSWGRIGFKLMPGDYEIKGYFQDTWPRTVGNSLTVLSLLFLVLMMKNKLLRSKLTEY
ncbi:MAG TPA: 6-pyruvoyl-tetrahydropterin synthase-related protein [Patescibacteria group bacterium]|nr:6-pyruvoyl-tetrahydropterin synthase-related protein [Patescibacteria group bacterium]